MSGSHAATALPWVRFESLEIEGGVGREMGEVEIKVAGDDGALSLRDEFVAEGVEEAVGVEGRLGDLLLVEEAEAAVEDPVDVAVLFEDVGEDPVGEGVDEADGFGVGLEMKLRRRASRGVVGGRGSGVPLGKVDQK